MAERQEKRISGCLLLDKTVSSKGPVLLCGKCPNRSDMVGDLTEMCHHTPSDVA